MIVLGLAMAWTRAKHGTVAPDTDDGRRSDTGNAGSVTVGHSGRRGKFLGIGGALAWSRRAEKAALWSLRMLMRGGMDQDYGVQG